MVLSLCTHIVHGLGNILFFIFKLNFSLVKFRFVGLFSYLFFLKKKIAIIVLVPDFFFLIKTFKVESYLINKEKEKEKLKRKRKVACIWCV